MKHLLFLLLFPFLVQAQSIRLYPVGTDRVIADGATGTVLFIKPSADVSLSALDPSVIQLVVKGVLFGRYYPANFLKQDGTAYSSASVTSAIDAYKASIPAIANQADVVSTSLVAAQALTTAQSATTTGAANAGAIAGLQTGKQNTLTFDSTPTTGSNNPITSGGVKTALTNKPDYVEVASFATAQAQITTGVLKRFLITNNELYSAPTITTYDGSNWYHSPAFLQNN